MPFWEANGSPASQKFSHLLWNPSFMTVFTCPYAEPEIRRITLMKTFYKNDKSDVEKAEHKQKFLEVCRSQEK